MKASFIAFVLLVSIPFVSLRAQEIKVCTTNRNAPPKGPVRWPRNTLVRVYVLKDMFTPQEKDSLLHAINIWTKAAQKVGAEVSFIYAGDTDGPAICDDCLTVAKRQINKSNRKIYGIFSPSALDEDGLLSSARIDLDFAITNPRALLGIMLHELGHGVGLGNCNDCKKKQTIMSGFSSINRYNGLTEPAACDLEVLRRIYRPDGGATGAVDNASP